jgi:hypothetical protein
VTIDNDYEHEEAKMSAQEIIAELPKLNPEELRLVREKLSELDAVAASATPKTGWGKALLEIAGSVNGLPDDLGANHDFYLHGTHKKEPRRERWIPADKGTSALTDSERMEFADKLVELACETHNLPADLAANHNHYLHGLPKR